MDIGFVLALDPPLGVVTFTFPIFTQLGREVYENQEKINNFVGQVLAVNGFPIHNIDKASTQ